MTYERHISVGLAHVAILCIAIAFYGCASNKKITTIDEPLEMQVQPEVVIKTDEQSDVVIKTAEPASPPVITSISPSKVSEGKFTVNIKGSGFVGGVEVVFFDASGKLVGSGKLKDRTDNQVVVSVRNIRPGRYSVKVKGADGLYSNAETLIIYQKPKPAKNIKPQCSGNYSKNPKVVYLGGGDAVQLFEGFLAHNGGIKLDYSFKVKYYEKNSETSNSTLRTIGLNDMEQLFVEYQEDFLNKIRKRLKGKIAELPDTFTADALSENADYYMCP